MSYKPPAGIIGHAVAALFLVDPGTALERDLLRLQAVLETGPTGRRYCALPTIKGVLCLPGSMIKVLAFVEFASRPVC